MNSEGYFSGKQLQAPSFLTLGLGGVYFHGALIQGDKYNLHVSNNSQLQVISSGIVTAIIPVTGRSLSKVRRACWQLSLHSKNYTF